MKDNEDAETCSVVSDAPGPSPVRCWHVVTLSHVASSCRKHLNSHNVEENRYSSLEIVLRVLHDLLPRQVTLQLQLKKSMFSFGFCCGFDEEKDEQ